MLPIRAIARRAPKDARMAMGGAVPRPLLPIVERRL
jgi:hypothetical protein